MRRPRPGLQHYGQLDPICNTRSIRVAVDARMALVLLIGAPMRIRKSNLANSPSAADKIFESLRRAVISGTLKDGDHRP